MPRFTSFLTTRVAGLVVVLIAAACGGGAGGADGGGTTDGTVGPPPGSDGGVIPYGPCRGTETRACPETGTCDDGLRCNGVDICDGEFGCVCDPDRPPVDCLDTVACTEGRCVEPSGECQQDLLHERCDDGNVCTVDACTLTGCENTPVADETVCTSASGEAGACFGGFCCSGCWDGTNCQPGDTLTACGAGAPCRGCDDEDECTADACESSSCSSTPVTDGTSCMDGTGVCFDGSCSCVGGCDRGNECEVGACESGSCSYTPVTDGTSCEDGAGACADGMCCTGCRGGSPEMCQPPSRSYCGVQGELCRPCQCASDTCEADGSCPPLMFEVGSVSVGSTHVCALTTSGVPYCWGQNDRGQLGIDSAASFTGRPTRLGSGSDWQQIAAGFRRTCGIRAGGTLWCWGDNSGGRLGLGIPAADLAFAPTPRQVTSPAETWSRVELGQDHACALTVGGAIFCWGTDGTQGRLGDCVSGSNNTDTPVRVAEGTDLDSVWVELSVGDTHSCAIRAEDGGGRRLYCWGNGQDGRLGNGGGSQSCPSPVGVCADGVAACLDVDCTTGVGSCSFFDDWESVSAGTAHTCALRASGELYCWGDGTNGRLGLGDTARRDIPTQVGTVSDWSFVAASRQHTCAGRRDGALYCWGWRSEGRLGVGAVTETWVPVEVSPWGDAPWVAVGSRVDSTCGLQADGTVACWGQNAQRQLGQGDEDTADRDVPARVCFGD